MVIAIEHYCQQSHWLVIVLSTTLLILKVHLRNRLWKESSKYMLCIHSSTHLTDLRTNRLRFLLGLDWWTNRGEFAIPLSIKPVYSADTFETISPPHLRPTSWLQIQLRNEQFIKRGLTLVRARYNCWTHYKSHSFSSVQVSAPTGTFTLATFRELLNQSKSDELHGTSREFILVVDEFTWDSGNPGFVQDRPVFFMGRFGTCCPFFELVGWM